MHGHFFFNFILLKSNGYEKAIPNFYPILHYGYKLQ